MATNWSDIYPDSTPQEVELDEGGKALLAIVPDSFKEQAATMLPLFLANIRLSLGMDDYMQFIDQMKIAATAYQKGDKDTCRTIMASYGVPAEMVT